MKKSLELKWCSRLSTPFSLSKFNLLRFSFVLLLSFLMTAVSAQTSDRTIRGVITDAGGETMIGVTVAVKGTTIGTTTDFDGNYTLKVPIGSILCYSFVGMKTQEITLVDQTQIDVVMQLGAIGLEEVVAIGYTTRKKGEVTGSVSTVSSESIARTSSNDVAKSLSGKVPGLIISDRGGYPGGTGDMTLLIRGKSTLGNNSPLILIDGITASTFSHLSPQDIESLTVLKDGAAAIYGARAANGVILITTKRGKHGKPKVNFSSSYNMSSFSASPDLMTSEEYAIYENEIAERNGTEARFSQEEIDKYADGSDPLNYPNTDWADLTFADYSPELRANLSVSGGNESMNYFVSGDYIDQVGMYESGDLWFNQYQVRSNLDINIWDNFKLGVDLSGRFGSQQEPGVDDAYIYKHIYTNEPGEIGYYSNGLPGWGGENGANPAVMSSSESGFVKTDKNDLRGKFSIDWDLGQLAEGLKAKGFAGIRKMSNDQKSWYTPWTVYQYQEASDEYLPIDGFTQSGNSNILRETYWEYNELMLNATVHYDRTFDDHTIRGFVGYEQTTSDERTFWVERKDFPSDDHPELFAGNVDGQESSGTSEEWGRVNYFGSLSYDYSKRYFIDFTLRRDGSSNFDDGKQFGTFPGVAVSWSLADEKFMSFTDQWLNALKLRASWAIMGNDRIDAFQYLTSYSYSGNTNAAQPNYYTFGTTGVRYNGYESNNVPNPDITWETADMRNFGVSFTVLNRRLSGDVNYFYQRREDILIQRNASIPDAAGLTLPEENLGKVDNFGWEFQLDWNDEIGDVNYNIGANLTQAKNEVVYMDEAADVKPWLKQEGHPMDSYIVFPTAGIFYDQAEVDATTAKLEGTVEGEPIYLDTDEDGEITTNDRVRSYSSNVPEIQYGIYGGLSYKGWSFNFLLQGQAKAKTLVFFDQSGSKPDFVFDERWTSENRDARYPRAFTQGDKYSGNQSDDVDNPEFADLYLHDASYLRLKNIELGYTFDKETLKVGELKLYVRGTNLLTMFSEIYDMDLDPEAEGYYNFRQSTYPSLKSYTLGLNFTF